MDGGTAATAGTCVLVLAAGATYHLTFGAPSLLTGVVPLRSLARAAEPGSVFRLTSSERWSTVFGVTAAIAYTWIVLQLGLVALVYWFAATVVAECVSMSPCRRRSMSKGGGDGCSLSKGCYELRKGGRSPDLAAAGTRYKVLYLQAPISGPPRVVRMMRAKKFCHVGLGKYE